MVVVEDGMETQPMEQQVHQDKVMLVEMVVLRLPVHLEEEAVVLVHQVQTEQDHKQELEVTVLHLA